MSSPTGRINIALTGPAEMAKDAVRGHFTDAEGLTLMRLGLAYAVRCQLPITRDDTIGRPGDGQNVNVGSFDPSGEIRALMTALYPDADDPFAVAEVLMSRGLIKLEQDLKAGRVSSLADVMNAEHAVQP
jgi:hypothetical protein